MIVACIPAFNEETNLPGVIKGLKGHVDKVIVCDDGSKDGTARVARRAGAMVVVHGRNLGYGAAISTLFREARREGADIMVTIDGDGQHNPADTPLLLEPVLQGVADLVIGSRALNSGDETPGYRRLGIDVINNTTNLISAGAIGDTQSGFRAYSSRILSSVTPSEMGMGASVEILVKAKEMGFKVAEVPVRIRYASHAARNPAYHGLDVMLALVKHLSIRHPLLLYGVPGFALFLLGLGFGLWTIDIYAATKTVAANIALIAVAGVMVGLLLMTTAIILWIMVSVVRGIE